MDIAKRIRIAAGKGMAMGWVCLLGTCLMAAPRPACAVAPLTIDLEAIRLIESSDSPVAVNEATGCYGLYQISEICLKDYNQSERTAYQVRDLFDPRINERIASWYFKRVARMLKHFGIPVDLTTVLASYNWGIGHVVAWHRGGASFQDLPRETRHYIRKYERLTGASA